MYNVAHNYRSRTLFHPCELHQCELKQAENEFRPDSKRVPPSLAPPHNCDSWASLSHERTDGAARMLAPSSRQPSSGFPAELPFGNPRDLFGASAPFVPEVVIREISGWPFADERRALVWHRVGGLHHPVVRLTAARSFVLTRGTTRKDRHQRKLAQSP